MFIVQICGCKFGDKCAFAHRRVEEQPNKRSQKKWRHRSSCSVERDTELGLCISGRAAKIVIDFTEELNHDETNPMCQIFHSSAAQCQTSRPKPVRSIKFVMGILISAAPTVLNLRNGLRKRQSGKSTGLAKERETQSCILLAYGKVVLPFTIQNQTGGKRICGRLPAVDTHGSEFCRVGDF